MRKKMRKALLILFGVVAIAGVGAQFVPVDRSNPPVTMEVDAPDEVLTVLRRSCYDCHSNETRWPWYSRVAPASWLVARDVRLGREEMNFSTWDRYSAEDRADHIEEVYEESAEGEMPPSVYLPLHATARLTDEDLAALRRWAGATDDGHDDHDDDDDD